MKKIKVLFTLPNFKTAGSSREMLNIVEGLDKSIFEAWVGVQELGGELFDEIIEKKIPIVVQPFMTKEHASLLSKVRKSIAFAKNFKSLEFDIWQSFNWSSDFSEAMVARRSGAKYVFVKKNMNWGRKAWMAKSMLSSAIIARNKTMIETFLEHKRIKKKVTHIPGGVDINKFKPSFDLAARKKYNIPENAFLICCVAQIVRSKDQATLIRAVAKVKDVHLLLAGAVRDEAYNTEIKSLARQLNVQDRVQFLGNIDDVNELLNISNAFVLPTSTHMGHEEGSPVSVLEAMATGTVSIVSDVAGNRDLIEHGKTGLIFKPERTEQLADCIRELIAKPSYMKGMAEKALDTAYAEYTLDKEINRFGSLYKKLMNRP